jgi:hypothetical protein
MNEDLRLMTRAGKTFYFATFWLTAEARNDAAIAYSFCRKIDDVADGGLPQEQRDEYLRSVTRALSSMDRTFPGIERMLRACGCVSGRYYGARHRNAGRFGEVFAWSRGKCGIDDVSNPRWTSSGGTELRGGSRYRDAVHKYRARCL